MDKNCKTIKENILSIDRKIQEYQAIPHKLKTSLINILKTMPNIIIRPLTFRYRLSYHEDKVNLYKNKKDILKNLYIYKNCDSNQKIIP